MECRLARSPLGSYWQCQVSLRIEYDDNTQQRLSQVKEIKFGPNLVDPALLEDVLQRAQLAILNPSVNPDLFVSYNLERPSHDFPLGSSKQLQFSKNIVCVELSGPDLTDLSFIDLPGKNLSIIWAYALMAYQ